MNVRRTSHGQLLAAVVFLCLFAACESRSKVGEQDGGRTGDTAIKTDAKSFPSFRAFVTSSLHRGDFADSENIAAHIIANRICQQRADAADLGGKWVAWLSTFQLDGFNPIDAIDAIENDGTWSNLRGEVLFKSRDALTRGVEAANFTDEAAQELGPSRYAVWTGSTSEGTLDTAHHCDSWTSRSPNTVDIVTGKVGDPNENEEWSESRLSLCSFLNHFYCFEQ